MIDHTNQLTTEIANEIGDKLVDIFKISHWTRLMFVQSVEDQSIFEFRFGGTLGMGGKIYFQRHRGFRVSCYQENEGPEQKASIKTMMDWLIEKGYHTPRPN